MEADNASLRQKATEAELALLARETAFDRERREAQERAEAQLEELQLRLGAENEALERRARAAEAEDLALRQSLGVAEATLGAMRAEARGCSPSVSVRCYAGFSIGGCECDPCFDSLHSLLQLADTGRARLTAERRLAEVRHHLSQASAPK